MPRIIECPKCGQDIGANYIEAEPDVGFMCGHWVCEDCDVAVADEGDDYDPSDDYVDGPFAFDPDCSARDSR